MAQPPAYDRVVSFTNLQAASPADPTPGTSLDQEYNRIKITTDALRTNLALIQRDDGELANNSVGFDQLSPEVSVGVNPADIWETATAYAVGDTVFTGSILYRAIVAHTSGTFATDLAVAKWVEIADFAAVVEEAVALEVAAQAIPSAVLTVRGDLIRRNATVAERVALGTSGYALISNGLDPAWAGFVQAGTGASTRTWQTKLREVFSVADFGAIGDGATDDSTAIQAAITAAEAIGAGKIVSVPVGTHIVTNLTITTASLVGSPGSVLKKKAATAAPMITVAGDHVVIEGLKWDGNGANVTGTNAQGVTVNDSQCTIRNNLFTGFDCYVVHGSNDSVGMHVHNNRFEANTGSNGNQINVCASDALIEGNSFDDIGAGHCVRVGQFGADTNPVLRAVVTGNRFSNCDHVGVCCEVYARYTTISGNVFDDCNQAIKCEAAGGTCHHVTITGNTFKDIVAGTAFNIGVLYVTFTGNVCYSCGGSVDTGGYSVVSGNVINDPDGVGILAHDHDIITGNLIVSAAGDAIQLSTDDAVCTGNMIQNCAADAIQVEGDRCLVDGNKIDGCVNGINMVTGSADCTVVNNDTVNYSGAAIAGAGATATGHYYRNNRGAYGQGLAAAATIAAGVLAIPSGAVRVVVDTEAAAAADDLDTITATYAGHTVTYNSANSNRDPTFKDGTGNLILAGDFVISDTADTITLQCDGTSWREIGRADNA